MPKNSENNEVKYLTVYIRSRVKRYFKGTASSVSSVNETGEFDILPYHANFITLVSKYILIDKDLPSEKKYEINTAVLSVLENKVDVYVDIGS